MSPHAFACPTCGSENIKYLERSLFNSGTLRFDICGECNLAFMNPAPTQTWYDRLYSGEFWEEKSKRQSGSAVELNTKMWRKSLQRASKLGRFLERAGFTPANGGRILEVGSAYGIIVSDLARRFECQAIGVEPSHSARAFSEQFVEVSHAAESMAGLAEWDGNGTVDMMVFSHVLENIVDLGATFSTIRRILKPGGRVLIETPNIYFPRSTHIYHPYSFCRASLGALLMRHGFKIEHAETSGTPSSVMSPKYLTILARMGELDRNAIVPRGHRLARQGMWLGRIWYAIASRFPLRFFDKILSARKYAVNGTAEKRLIALEAAVLDAGKE